MQQERIAATGRTVAFIGFGEAARAFAAGWGREACSAVAAFDVKVETEAGAAAISAACDERGVALCPGRQGALAEAEVVFCMVTADRAVEAAQQAAAMLRPGALWLDCNSCAPASKRAAAAVIEAAGGRYVDVAVMAPVHPRLHRTPLLLAGAAAPEVAEWMVARGMACRAVGPEVGSASSIKMLRSVMIKGMEALHAECFLAARAAGVEAEVLASLQASNPEVDWSRAAAYNLERMMQHGTRRAAEMREVALTVSGLGLPEAMSSAAVKWHDRIGALGLADAGEDLFARLDRIRERL